VYIYRKYGDELIEKYRKEERDRSTINNSDDTIDQLNEDSNDANDLHKSITLSNNEQYKKDS